MHQYNNDDGNSDIDMVKFGKSTVSMWKSTTEKQSKKGEKKESKASKTVTALKSVDCNEMDKILGESTKQVHFDPFLVEL